VRSDYSGRPPKHNRDPSLLLMILILLMILKRTKEDQEYDQDHEQEKGRFSERLIFPLIFPPKRLKMTARQRAGGNHYEQHHRRN
jgi:hypothetical protein